MMTEKQIKAFLKSYPRATGVVPQLGEKDLVNELKSMPAERLKRVERYVLKCFRQAWRDKEPHRYDRPHLRVIRGGLGTGGGGDAV